MMIELNLVGNNLPLMNEWQRWHFRKRAKFMKNLAWEVRYLLQQTDIKLCDARFPLKRCRIRVVRFKQFGPEPDADAVLVKPLLDILQPTSKRHPYGLGLIADDTREVVSKLETDVARGASRLVVQITEEPDEGQEG